MLEYPQLVSTLADDVRAYGQAWVKRSWTRVGHLYPPISDDGDQQTSLNGDSQRSTAQRPIAYLWTRTVRCPNPALGAHELPLVRQTWLAKKKGRFVALRPQVDREALTVRWEVVEADSAEALGFDPAAFSSRGRSTCLVCGAAVDAKYVKAEGVAGRMGIAPLVAVMVKPSGRGRGRDYLAAGEYVEPGVEECEAVLAELELEPPDELVQANDTLNFKVPLYGLTRFRDLFTPRQLATLCSLAQGVRESHAEMLADGMSEQRAEATAACLGLVLNRVVDRSSNLCRWDTKNESLTNTYARQALPMVWDFAESNPYGSAAGVVTQYVDNVADIMATLASAGVSCQLHRTSATQLPCDDSSYDAVVTDPPYYDNIAYADLSDFFYVWLKRSVGFLFPEHLGGELTPKRREIIVAAHRHDGDAPAARAFYEREMALAWREAYRVLKPGAPLVCVYAHKTTLGWASLVKALRTAGFTLTEAWPVDTEMRERAGGQGTASLASSIFLVARRREGNRVGSVGEVTAELDRIVAERLDRLTTAGVSGSDLIIAAIGAGLRPFTQFASVELPNGEELSVERFLEQVQGRVLNAVLARVHHFPNDMGGIDQATRYYVLARYSYGYADVDFDEANNLARSAGVELTDGFSKGHNPLANVSGRTVHLRDYAERGGEPDLGLAASDGSDSQMIDVLQGLLWRATSRRYEVKPYLDETRPDAEGLRLVAQALQGKALRDASESKPAEAQACERLLGSWRSIVEDNLFRGG